MGYNELDSSLGYRLVLIAFSLFIAIISIRNVINYSNLLEPQSDTLLKSKDVDNVGLGIGATWWLYYMNILLAIFSILFLLYMIYRTITKKSIFGLVPKFFKEQAEPILYNINLEKQIRKENEADENQKEIDEALKVATLSVNSENITPPPESPTVAPLKPAGGGTTPKPSDIPVGAGAGSPQESNFKQLLETFLKQNSFEKLLNYENFNINVNCGYDNLKKKNDELIEYQKMINKINSEQQILQKFDEFKNGLNQNDQLLYDNFSRQFANIPQDIINIKQICPSYVDANTEKIFNKIKSLINNPDDKYNEKIKQYIIKNCVQFDYPTGFFLGNKKGQGDPGMSLGILGCVNSLVIDKDGNFDNDVNIKQRLDEITPDEAPEGGE